LDAASAAARKPALSAICRQCGALVRASQGTDAAMMDKQYNGHNTANQGIPSSL